MLERLEGDEDLAQAVLVEFLSELPKRIEQLRSSLAAGDLDSSERQAHAIRGAAASIGGDALREVARIMERAASGGGLDTARGSLDHLEEQVERLKEAIGFGD